MTDVTFYSKSNVLSIGGTEVIPIVQGGTTKYVTPSQLATYIQSLMTTGTIILPWGGVGGSIVNQTDLQSALVGKQSTLISGTTIMTINSTSLLQAGNLSLQPTLVSGSNIKQINGNTLLGSTNLLVQDVLVSGTNIKSINGGTSLLGTGDIPFKTINSLSIFGSGDIAIPTAGAIGSSGLTMNTNKILGRGTSGAGAVEEITIGSGLSLSGTTLTATGGGGGKSIILDYYDGRDQVVDMVNPIIKKRIPPCTINSVIVSLDIVNTGDDFIIQVWKTHNGTPTQSLCGNITITDGQSPDVNGLYDIAISDATVFASGDMLSVICYQVGSIIPGTGLSIQILGTLT